jgi:hypothetical protein
VRVDTNMLCRCAFLGIIAADVYLCCYWCRDNALPSLVNDHMASAGHGGIGYNFRILS